MTGIQWLENEVYGRLIDMESEIIESQLLSNDRIEKETTIQWQNNNAGIEK